MKLTPLDIHHKEFRNALRGYNPEQVDDFLDEVADEFERLFKENIDMKEALDTAEERVRAYGVMEHTLQNTLVSAQQSAEDITSRARVEAERLLRDSETKAQEVVSSALAEKQHSQAEYTRLEGAEVEFRARFRRMLEGYLAGLAPEAAASEAVDPEPIAEPAPAPMKQLQVEVPAEPTAPAEPAAAKTASTQAEAGATGEVRSLTLGEAGDDAPIEEDVPSLEVPPEFNFSRHTPVGDLDDDIEEID
jgi:cell division initiation protein